jgi:DNA polymerase-3 subunit beta
MSADDLEAALSTVKYAIATDQTRIILTGVLLEVYADKMNAVALDGYRLALSQKPCVSDIMAEHESCVVPGESLPVIMAAIDGAREARIESDGKQLRVQTEYGQATTGLLVGDYLDYRKTIPRDYRASIRFFGRDMVNALKRANALGKVELVKLTLRDAMVVVESNTASDEFYEEVPCQHSGEDMRTAYNTKYFMECRNATDADELQLDLVDKTTAGVIRRTDGEKELHLLLPVRLAT